MQDALLVAEDQRISIRRRRGDEARPDGSAAAGTDDGEHGLPEIGLHDAGEGSRMGVVRSARRIGDDQTDRLGRKVALGDGRRGAGNHERERAYDKYRTP
jgi:hypothetical protein